MKLHSEENFADLLATAVLARKTPVLVGLDPRWEQLPDSIRGDRAADDHESVAQAYLAFCRSVIDVVAPLVPVVKPQSAFFEQIGPHGMRALKEVIDYAHEKGLLVILDAKRNDIASTATAYADGLLGCGNGAWSANALTVSPYLGEDSLVPFLDVAQKRNCGLFVLVKTSNAGGGMFQDLIAEGKPIYRHVAEFVQSLCTRTLGSCGYGIAGAVVGATYREQLNELREVMRSAWILVPGFGSQGGTARDVAGAFDTQGLGAIINNSRGIIFAHRKPEYANKFGEARWQEAVEAATIDMIEKLAADTNASKLRSPKV